MNRSIQALKAIAAASVMFLSTQTVIAQEACAPSDKAKLQLEKQFDEQVAGRGLAANGKQMLELFVSKTGSWTVLLSDTEGRSCVVAAGEAWHDKKPIQGDPA